MHNKTRNDRRTSYWKSLSCVFVVLLQPTHEVNTRATCNVSLMQGIIQRIHIYFNKVRYEIKAVKLIQFWFRNTEMQQSFK
jgi:hypothetical protein